MPTTRTLTGVLAVVAGVLAIASSSYAQQPAAKAPTAPPVDLSGFWVNQYTPDLARVLGSQPPFTAEGAERWRTVDTAKDPTGRCWPPGPSRVITAPFPFLAIQHQTMIALAFEYFTIWRVIYLDGRPHPPDIADYPDFMGHSIGHWEGNVLVVDTVGIDARTWLDTAGHEHSDKLHLVERFEKVDATIKWTVTFEDPVFFTRPWSITRTFTPGKAGDRILAYTCTDNNRDVEHLQTNQPNLDYKHQPETAR
jgi:hypothetical protein